MFATVFFSFFSFFSFFRWSKLKAESQARFTEHLRATAVQKALNEHTQNLQTARHDADSARTELDGLRAAIQGRSNNPSGESTSAPDKRTAALGDVLQQCGQAYQELARRADGHVADILLLQGAWPK